MNNCVFTIVAKNYIGLAQVLEESLQLHNPDLDFFIFVADELHDSFDATVLPENVVSARENLDIPPHLWQDMSFKYDILEFCTSIKPQCFQYLFDQKGYEKVVYLDPDILVFNSFDAIFDMLQKHHVVLTPHISIMRKKYIGELHERSLMGLGIYNLGFCAMKRSKQVQKLLVWWHDKLIDKCYVDQYNNLFTDQKWMDILPCFLNNDELLITRHLGMNLAPWNFFERKIHSDQNTLMVSARENEDNDEEEFFPLIFTHFSGYNYKELKKEKIVRSHLAFLNEDSYQDITILLNIYRKALNDKAEVVDAYIEEKYTYNTFENGDEIKKFHRRLYRSLTKKRENVGNPFAVGEKSFHSALQRSGMTKSNASGNVYKADKEAVGSYGSKLAVFNKITRLCYKILGLERYILLIRLLRGFSQFEAQIHLLDSKFDTDNIDI